MRTASFALVQLNSKIGDIATNIARAKDFIEDAASQGADIVVFPELCTCGYNSDYLTAHRNEMALSADDAYIKEIGECAKKNNIYVILPANILEDGHYFNGAFIFERGGEIVGIYKKAHLWDVEARMFEKGSEYRVYDFDFGKFAYMICYDAGFPEAARMMALQGAEVLMYSGAFCGTTWERWNKYPEVRALENTMYVGAVNATGGEGTWELWFGNNLFCDYNGERIMEGRINIEEMQIVEVDLDKIAEERAAGCYLTDLRLETYLYYNK